MQTKRELTELFLPLSNLLACRRTIDFLEENNTELKMNEDLQDKFILAWSSIEKYTRNINSDPDKRKEAKILISQLKKTNTVILLH